MGSSDSKAKKIKLNLEEWEKVEDHATFDVMRNKNTGTIGQLYHFVIPENREVDEEVKNYLYRNGTSDNVVKVHGIDVEEEGFGFCGNQKMAKILTERMPVRLDQSRPLNREEEACVLYNSLKGFDQLYNRYGPVDVNPEMIGFNQAGQTKVWMNRNYGMNYASDNRKTHFEDFRGSEQNMMINNIVEVIEEKSQGRRLSEPLRSEVLRRGLLADAAEAVVRNANVRPEFLFQNQMSIGPEEVVLYNNQVERTSQGPLALNSSPPLQATIQTSQPPLQQQSIQHQPIQQQQVMYSQSPQVSNMPTRVSQPMASQQMSPQPMVSQQMEPRVMDSMAYQQSPIQQSVNSPVYATQMQQPRAASSKFSFSYTGNSNLR